MATAIKLKRVLTDSVPGKKEIVSHFNNEQMASKLLAMGILPDSQIQLVRKSLFGGEWVVKADNMYIALRCEEASCIVLK